MELQQDNRTSTRSNIKYHRARRILPLIQHRRSKYIPRTIKNYRRYSLKLRSCIILAKIRGTNLITMQGMQAHGKGTKQEVTDLILKYSKDPISKMGIRNDPLSTKFDTDSYVLGFYCQSSAYILNIEIHFEYLRQ